MKKVIIPALAFVFFAVAVNAQDVKKTDTAPKPVPAPQAQQAQPAANSNVKPAEATTHADAQKQEADKKETAQPATQNQAK